MVIVVGSGFSNITPPFVLIICITLVVSGLLFLVVMLRLQPERCSVKGKRVKSCGCAQNKTRLGGLWFS